MSSNFNWDSYLSPDELIGAVKETTTIKNPNEKEFSWDDYQEAPPLKEESTLSQIGRTLYQPLAGYAQKYTFPLNILQAIGTGDALNELDELEERLPRLREMFPGANLPESIDREKYLESLQQAQSYFPTQQNIEKGIEDLIGLPLTSQNEGQNLLRIAGSAAAFRPGSVGEKAAAATVTPLTKATLVALGVPEFLAEPIAYMTGALTPVPSISKQVKPSGLAKRGYEDLNKPTKVSPSRFEKISEKVEGDFRSISDRLLEKSSETYSKMKKNPFFKDEVIEDFKLVQDLSKEIPGDVTGGIIKESFRARVNARDIKGVTLDEYEKNFLKESNKLYKEIRSKKSFTAENLVDQYRKNNKTLKEIFEPGKSTAQNRAKADAIIEYNRSIANIIENKYPGSEFSKLFKESNKLYSEIMDVEKVQSFIDEIFDGKINFNKAEKFMGKERLTRSFKNVLGKEGYQDFTGLMKDFMGAKEGYSMLRRAETMGFKNLATHGAAWFISPTVGKLKGVFDVGKYAKNALLDKPKFISNWKTALDHFKKGEFKEADKLISNLEKKS